MITMKPAINKRYVGLEALPNTEHFNATNGNILAHNMLHTSGRPFAQSSILQQGSQTCATCYVQQFELSRTTSIYFATQATVQVYYLIFTIIVNSPFVLFSK